MDAYAPTMMSVGARGMIGKGARLPEVVEAMKNITVFTSEPSAVPAPFLPNVSKKAELIAYEDLGAEALRKLYVEDMPLVVIIDSEGNNLMKREEKSIWKRIKKSDLRHIRYIYSTYQNRCLQKALFIL